MVKRAMSFRPIDLHELRLIPYPQRPSPVGVFWPDPVEAGLYGPILTNVLLLTTNQRSSLARIGRAADALPITSLAVEAGGFAPPIAASLKMINGAQFQQVLSRLERDTPGQIHYLLAPYTLAKHFAWKNDTRLGNWVVRVVPDDPTKLASALKEIETPRPVTEFVLPDVFQRLVSGLALWFGQALLFAIPLIVFGWQALVQGILALLVGAVFLALLWGLLPRSSWLKGLITGVILSCAVGLALFLAGGAGWNIVLFPILGIFLATFWMGLVFGGVRV